MTSATIYLILKMAFFPIRHFHWDTSFSSSPHFRRYLEIINTSALKWIEKNWRMDRETRQNSNTTLKHSTPSEKL